MKVWKTNDALIGVVAEPLASLPVRDMTGSRLINLLPAKDKRCRTIWRGNQPHRVIVCLRMRSACWCEMPCRGESFGKKSGIRTSGRRNQQAFLITLYEKRRRSCPVDLAVPHPVDGRCGLWTAISSSKLHVAQSAGYIRRMTTKKQSQLLMQGSEMVKYGSLD